ncbi:protocadherin gamma-A3-like [Haliotis asinina]|uniref:protocadherin gamma-A3-like n=1 Tax=Haliotis asinina TaxID=109174 RepID=UPI00353244BA
MSNTIILGFLLLTSFQLTLCITLTYTIDEQQPAGSFLGNIASDANLRDYVSEEEFYRLRYSFLTQGNPHTSNFSIDSTSGAFTTARELDRETLCNFLNTCKLSFEAVAQSNLGSFFKKIQLEVNVRDINDNAPEFTTSTYVLQISEGANSGSNFPLVSAVDRDTGFNNSVKSYDLQPKDTPFILITTAGVSGIMSISLELVQRLDRETTDFYELFVFARDGGSPQRTGTLTLHINVADVNDNPPVFDNSKYTLNISETTAAGSVIIRLSASDKDSGNNANISYHFMPRQPESVLNLFKLDQVTGELRTAGSLEYEAGKMHQVIVEAHDHGVPSKTTQAVVIITIIDTHNDAPEMHINVFHDSGIAEISEFSEVGRVVAHIAVEDPDSGSNGNVQCSMPNSSFELRALDKNEFKVILVNPLDRETEAFHNVSVICHDGGSPALSVQENFLVRVIDENDNAPEFPEDVYYANIVENKKIGTSIMTFTATDIDNGTNAELIYKVQDDHGHRFNIFRNGTLVTAMEFDREEYPEVVAKILAVDQGNPPMTATTTVIITVDDVNDQAPVFDMNKFQLSVPEESKSYTSVGQITASDSDLDENAIIMYQLHSSTRSDFPFIVYADGVIKTNRILDREVRDHYEFVVVATDLGQPPLSSTARVVVTLDDINDHTPVIIFPTQANNTVTMPHTQRIESPVIEITAVDMDVERNAEISYFIEGGNGSAVFVIDHKTGIVRLRKQLESKHVTTVYSLMVVAQDHGSPQRSTQSELFIEVILGNTTLSVSNQGSINIITAMVLVGVTILLAVIVVATICLLRSSDKKKRLYRAKAEEEKVISSMRRHGSSISSSSKNSTTPLAEKDGEKKEKEVSFSLDEENNVSLSSGSVGFNARNNECLFTIPEDTENDNKKHHMSKQQKFSTFKDDSEKNHTHIRFHDDSGSDLSGDVSISDSGRGGSDIELQSHGGSSNVLESDMSFSGHPRHPKNPVDHQSASPAASFSTFYGSDPHGTSYDNSSLSGSVQSKQIPDNHLHNGAVPYRARANNSAPPTQRLSIPPRMKNNSHTNHGVPPRGNYSASYGQLSQNGGRHKGQQDSGAYVHLKHPMIEGEYMDMNGHKMSRMHHVDDTVSEMNTSAWDNDTTTSGSYTVDPEELCDEIDRLFFKQNMNKDIIV